MTSFAIREGEGRVIFFGGKEEENCWLPSTSSATVGNACPKRGKKKRRRKKGRKRQGCQPDGFCFVAYLAGFFKAILWTINFVNKNKLIAQNVIIHGYFFDLGGLWQPWGVAPLPKVKPTPKDLPSPQHNACVYSIAGRLRTYRMFQKKNLTFLTS